MAANRSLLAATWAWCCSLKLTIVLASVATVLTMVGSLLVHFYPRTFGGLDTMVLADWWRQHGATRLGLSWWLPLAGGAALLLGVNTLCCFLDWLWRIRARWRKCGEYLIHLGFVLIVIAYCWGAQAGWRLPSQTLPVGATLPLPQLPGTALRLEAFEPQLNEQGRPLDMRSELTLLVDGAERQRSTVSINTPLVAGGLVVVPISFAQQPHGFRCWIGGLGWQELRAGSRLRGPGDWLLEVLRFYPDVRRTTRGDYQPRGEQLFNPAFELVLTRPDGSNWRGWYLLREGLPQELIAAGVQLRPGQPLLRTASILTINYDPGAGLALAGSVCMLIGVLLALVSFYRKRAHGDRPDIV